MIEIGQLILACIFVAVLLVALLMWSTVLPASWTERIMDRIWRGYLWVCRRRPRPY